MYMVIFRTTDGKPGYQQAPTVQDAASAVERLRNEDGVESVRIFRMEEVAFEYKVHYSVQLTEPAAPVESPIAPAAPAAAPAESDATRDELSWDDEATDDESASAPFDQMAVDPEGAPRWDDSAPDEPATHAVPDHIDLPGDEEVTSGDGEPRRGLFGR